MVTIGVCLFFLVERGGLQGGGGSLPFKGHMGSPAAPSAPGLPKPLLLLPLPHPPNKVC